METTQDSRASAVLAFREVVIHEGAEWDRGLEKVSFELGPGECLLVRLERGRLESPLADAAVGLAAPESGAVLFDGEDWAAAGPDRAASLRARIGRVFASREWISNLDVDENVTLPARHHAKKEKKEIEEEAERLARAFGLPGLPRARPAWVPPADLRRASWVRAFLGDPLLLVLEQPERDLSSAMASPLVEAVRSALERGAAVLWTTEAGPPWSGEDPFPVRRYALSGSGLVCD